MLNVKQAYILANALVKNLQLSSILSFEEDFGFLFVKNKNDLSFGTSYILVNKETKKISLLPTTPNNIQKIQSAKKIPLTLII